MVKNEFPGRISQVGVEKLRVAAPFTDVPITGADFAALRMDAGASRFKRRRTA